ncbi:hypothetical protein HDU93_002207 [Gonapodya sp. JEL0774]|nr:hypothetical protein HDU93_002207 [Gonapodya sp. JEL0774]
MPPAMSVISDQAITEAYEDVRNDNTPTDWMLMQYVDDKTDKLMVGSEVNGVSVNEHIRPTQLFQFSSEEKVLYITSLPNQIATCTYDPFIDTGAGGLAEFKSQLSNDKAAFGYIRLVLTNDGLSKRAKFLLVTWVPPGVKVMRKAKVSVHISDVKQVIKVYSVEVSGSQMDELREDDILLKAKKAMGANYGMFLFDLYLKPTSEV